MLPAAGHAVLHKPHISPVYALPFLQLQAFSISVWVIKYSWCLHCDFHLEAKASRTALQWSSNFGCLFTVVTVKKSSGIPKDGWWNNVRNISDLLSLFTSLAAFPTVPAASCAVSSFTAHLAYPQLNCRSTGVTGVVLGMLHMFQGRKDKEYTEEVTCWRCVPCLVYNTLRIIHIIAARYCLARVWNVIYEYIHVHVRVRARSFLHE